MASEWYFTKNGQRHGPITSQQLKELAAKGELGPADLVWKEGMPQWVPASKVKGLMPSSAAVTSKPTSPSSPTATTKARTSKPVKKEAAPDIPSKSTGVATKTKSRRTELMYCSGVSRRSGNSREAGRPRRDAPDVPSESAADGIA